MSEDHLTHLKEALDQAEWSRLQPHLQRDALIVVSVNVDLLEVGHAIATDASQKVQNWIQSRLIAKPSQEEIEAWDLMPDKKFMTLVIRPYVLIQEMLN